MAFDTKGLDDYIDVSERIAAFNAAYPDGSLQQVSISFEVVAGESYVVYTAAAYRTPDDPRPGMGTAWEPIPGKTPYTKGSEVQNAETAAWGRAVVALAIAGTKRGGSIASMQEVRNRNAERESFLVKRSIAARLPGVEREEIVRRINLFVGVDEDFAGEHDLEDLKRFRDSLAAPVEREAQVTRALGKPKEEAKA